MNKTALALGALGVVLYSRAARANTQTTPAQDDSAEQYDSATHFDPLFLDNFLLLPEQSYYPIPDMNGYSTGVDEMKTVAAFLYAIRRSEHSYTDVLSGLDYNTFYKGSRFSNMSDHPVNTGEKVGIKLSDSMCRNAGYSPGCVSTAAGAYQIIRPTWDAIRKAGVYGDYLPDFDVDSQDAAAVRLLKQSGAYTALVAGDVETAIYKASKLWASLPKSPAKQPQRSVDEVYSFFNVGLTLA